MDTSSLERAKCPEELGIPSQAVIDFLDDVKKSNIELHSFMLLRHGKIAAEGWWKPFKESVPHTMYSFSKSVSSTAIGFAISEGLISLDTKVYSLFPEKAPKIQTKYAKELTIEHLLTMTSGKLMNPMADTEKMDWIKNFLYAPFSRKPGTKFFYTNENSYMLCAIVNKVTGMSVIDYLTPRLFEPLGIDIPFWETDPNGVEAGGWGLQLKTEDQAKFIQCYANGGKWNGKQIIPEQWVKTATIKQVENAPGKPDNCVGYGYQFWRCAGAKGYRCDGLFGQFAIVMEDYDACFVTNAGNPMEQDVLDVIWRHFPSCFSDDALPENEEKAKELKERLAELEIPLLEKGARNFATENMLESKTIRLATSPFASLLAPPAFFMLSKKPGRLNNIKFHFEDDYCTFSWDEQKSPRNTIKVGLDGKYRYSQITLGCLKLDTASMGKWNGDGSFELWIRPLQMTQMRKMIFKFSSTGIVDVKSWEEQELKDLAVFWLGFVGLSVKEKLKRITHRVVKAALPVVDPNMLGRLIDDD
ncbi:MAG: beta-lactamase family protein [Clostridiales bacterium]|nr:beta-lactamase family protein [Clostridiales bacterium]